MTTLTIKEAADHFGVSERTIRRRIAAGELRATRAPMAQGYQVFVQVDNLDTTPDQVDTGSVNVDTPHDHLDSSELDVPVMAVVMEELDRVHAENRRLHDQTIQLAGQVGFLQAQLQQSQEQVKLLTDTQHAQDPPAPDPNDPEATQQHIPWWRRLLGR
jgi:excisionase family DNA binding protein